MRNDAFYATVAGVLPALVIALAVELRALGDRFIRQLQADLQEMDLGIDNQSDAGDEAVKRLRFASERVFGGGHHLALQAWLASAAFLAGELASCAALAYGTQGWRGIIFGTVAQVGLVVMALLAAVLLRHQAADILRPVVPLKGDRVAVLLGDRVFNKVVHLGPRDQVDLGGDTP